MNKKNSSAILKNQFKDYTELSKIYSEFKKKILKLKARKFLVAVSGGSDSLALAAMCRAMYSNYKQIKFYYLHINHGIRNKSLSESKTDQINKKDSKTIQELDREKLEKKFSKEDKEKLN